MTGKEKERELNKKWLKVMRIKIIRLGEQSWEVMRDICMHFLCYHMMTYFIWFTQKAELTRHYWAEIARRQLCLNMKTNKQNKNNNNNNPCWQTLRDLGNAWRNFYKRVWFITKALILMRIKVLCIFEII